MTYSPAQIRKALIALAAFAANLVAAGVLSGTAALVVMAAVSAAGTYGVFAATNAPA